LPIRLRPYRKRGGPTGSKTASALGSPYSLGRLPKVIHPLFEEPVLRPARPFFSYGEGPPTSCLTRRGPLSSPCAGTPLHDAVSKRELFSAVAFKDETLQVPYNLGVRKDQPLSAFLADEDDPA
jgi:hypothetical protein